MSGRFLPSAAMMAVVLLLTLNGPVLANQPPGVPPPRPESVQPFPAQPPTDESRRPKGSRPAGSARRSTSTSSVLGEPVHLSVALAKGDHYGYRFDAQLRVTSKRKVKLKAAEVDSATHQLTVKGKPYYLLSWGPLSGYWVKHSSRAKLVTTTKWKTLVMVYPATNATVTDAAGAERTVSVEVTDAHHQLMGDSVGTLPDLTRRWSYSLADQELTILTMDRAITEVDLAPLGGGAYWVGPHMIKADLDRYAPAGRYDSVFVIWQPWSGTYGEDDFVGIDSWGWGLATSPGYWTNGAGYATVTVPPADWWMGGTYPGEVFAHEWLHHVLWHYEGSGYRVPDLHAADQYGYGPDAAGSWWRWYSDVMQAHVWDASLGAYTGVTYAMWRSSTPSRL